MAKKDVKSFRNALNFLDKAGDLLTFKNEIDPIYEISGAEKALEESYALLFDNIKGYPGVRCSGNLFTRDETAAKLFGEPDYKKFKFQFRDAIRKPLPAKVVKEAPCQEVVITKKIDVLATIPIIKHTEADAGRIMGGGIYLATEPYISGNDLAFRRTHIRGKDWATVMCNPGSNFGQEARFVKQPIPITANIGIPPAAALVAGGGMFRSIVPRGSDELGIAGALQGFPVDICKARTVDAYSIAESEWVIEGYLDYDNRVWESEQAEKSEFSRTAPFFPEYGRYLGRCMKVWRFQITAITHRQDRPIFYTALADSFEGDNLEAMLNEACYAELCDRLYPGFVTDLHALHSQAGGWNGIVLQVNKRRMGDEGRQRQLLATVLNLENLPMAVVVDEDVDIYCAEDVLWAIQTRVNMSTGIVWGTSGAVANLLQPAQTISGSQARSQQFGFVAGIGFDATKPLDRAWGFERPKHPVHLIDLKKWLSAKEISSAQGRQSDYAKVLAKNGW